MYDEYCRYILTKNNIEDDPFKEKKKLVLDAIPPTFYIRKKELKLKKEFVPDYYLFDVLETFFLKEYALWGNDATDEVLQFLQEEKNVLYYLKEQWISHNRQSCFELYDMIFEVVTQLMLIMENGRISIQENNLPIDFCTTDIDIEALLSLLCEVIKAVPVSFIQKLSRFSKYPFKSVKNRAKKHSLDINNAYYYFYCIMEATHIRNEELKEEFGYGW